MPREADIPDRPADRRRAGRSWVALLSAASLVVLVAGALGVAHLRSQDRIEVLSVAQAAGTTTATGSARMTFRLQATPKAEFVMAGVVDFAHEGYSLRGTFAGQAYELRGIGPDQWSRTEGARGARQWTHLRRADGPGEGLSTGEPGRLLQRLRSAGVERSRHRAGGRTVLVVRAPVSTVSGTENDELVDIRIEVDRDGLVRRLSMDPPGGPGGVTVTYDDFGVPVDVAPPPANEVSEMADVLGDIAGLGDRTFREQFPELDVPSSCGVLDEQRKRLAETTSEANRATLDKLLADAKKACEARR